MAEFGDLGRFEEPSLLILVSLAGGAKHGYAIQQDVRGFSGINVGPGTLYAVLPRLESLGLIEALPSDDRRRPYRLTAIGLAALRTELERRRGVSETGLARLRGEA